MIRPTSSPIWRATRGTVGTTLTDDDLGGVTVRRAGDRHVADADRAAGPDDRRLRPEVAGRRPEVVRVEVHRRDPAREWLLEGGALDDSARGVDERRGHAPVNGTAVAVRQLVVERDREDDPTALDDVDRRVQPRGGSRAPPRSAARRVRPPPPTAAPSPRPRSGPYPTLGVVPLVVLETRNNGWEVGAVRSERGPPPPVRRLITDPAPSAP